MPTVVNVTDRKFWLNLVPQIALADDATWYAVLAVSAFFEHPPTTSLRGASFADDDLTRGWHRQALEWYGRSLRATAELPRSSKSILTTFLYAVLEMIHDRPDTGLKLIYQTFLLNEADHASGSADLEILDAALPMLSRALVPLSIFGCHLTPEQRQRARRPESLKQSNSAAATILNRMEELHDLIYDVQIFCNTLKSTRSPSETELASRQTLLHNLHTWRDTITQSTLPSSTGELRRFLAQLLILYETYRVKLSCIFSQTLLIFDTYEPSFSTIVSEATRVLSPFDHGDKAFAFEIAVVPCLYYTAWACRRPSVRRRAIELLRNQAPRQENLWTAESCLDVAERIVVYEEELSRYEPTVTPEQDLRLPPEYRRLPISAAGDPTRGVGAMAHAMGRPRRVSNTFWNVGVPQDAVPALPTGGPGAQWTSVACMLVEQETGAADIPGWSS